MRKNFILGCLVSLLFVLGIGAYYNVTSTFPGSTTSYRQSTSAAISATPAWLTSLTVITNGTDDVTLTLYDSGTTSAGASIIGYLKVAGASNNGFRDWTFPVRATNGIYAEISGTTPYYIVDYMAR